MRTILVALLAGEGGLILQASLQVALLVLAILLVKAFVGRRLPARWHAALWLLVVLRLVLPWTPASPTSAFNLAHLLTASNRPATAAAEASGSEAILPGSAGTALALSSSVARQLWPVALLAPTLLTLVWGTGALVLGASTLYSFLRLWGAVRARRLVTDQRVLDLLEDCKGELGLNTIVAVVESDRVKGPALFGFVRPRLLLPVGLVSALTREELRHVFLHELAHVRRLDVHLGWLTTVLLILHWFNPLVWLAFARLRTEREMACDEIALGRLGAEHAPAYGRTLLRLLESWSQPPGLAALAGVLESRGSTRRRIALVARYRPRRFRWSFLTAAPLAVLALVFLTNMTPPEAWAGAGLLDALGRRVDRIDHPFADDPAVLGGWRAVDLVPRPEAFAPGSRGFEGDLYLKELHFLERGRTSMAFRWTKGLVISDGDRTAARYEIRRLDGSDYLFMEWKNGDYTLGGREPLFYVLVRDPNLVHVESRREDRIDFPFVDDERVHGGWRSVDFVEHAEDFVPGRRAWRGDLFLKELHFLDGGRTSRGVRWTKGLVISEGDRTASRYEIRRLDGADYLFLEWKSGDYVYWGREPQLYVLVRDPTLVYTEQRREDEIDLPFVDDPHVHGSWRSVDFVERPERFVPGGRAWPGDLFLTGITFFSGGSTDGPWTWTRGVLIHREDRTASRYEIRRLEGAAYLFLEWKSGDYVFRGMTPRFYVFERTD